MHKLNFASANTSTHTALCITLQPQLQACQSSTTTFIVIYLAATKSEEIMWFGGHTLDYSPIPTVC